MGDRRRFDLFAKLIEKSFASFRTLPIVDVASGKGTLQAALRQRSFINIISWDRRPRNGKPRKFYRYGYFDFQAAPSTYQLVVAMHPDEGTDHAILYAVKHRVPFIVCPCCTKPSAAPYWGRYNFQGWKNHLMHLARTGNMEVSETTLPMNGRNVVLIGIPYD